MLRNLNLKSRRVFALFIIFVLLITLSACSSAGSPVGKLDTDTIYAQAGKYSVTKGELWNELKWSSKDILDQKITEVVLKDNIQKIELIMEKNYDSFTDAEKKLFSDDFSLSDYEKLKVTYTERLIDYVVEDIYDLSFSVTDDFKTVEDLNQYDNQKYIIKYSDEMYTTYGIKMIDEVPLQKLCSDALTDKDIYIIIAKKLKTLYYTSYAKELLAYDNLETEIQEAYDNRDKDDEDDLGYFTKSEFTTSYKNEFANQGDLNLILIRFASQDEYTATLRSFGLKIYDNQLVYIPAPATAVTFADYCKYYDDLTMNDRVDYYAIENSCGEVAILEIYIQIYNYLYSGYRSMLYTDKHQDDYLNIDLRSITEEITGEYEQLNDEQKVAKYNEILTTLRDEKDNYDFNTYYTREYIDNLDGSFNTYLYETLTTPFNTDEDNDDKCYSTSVQSYSNTSWIAFKLEQTPDEYEGIYEKNIVNDDLYDNIAGNEELYNKILTLLKRDAITSNKISTAVSEETAEVSVKIFDEALEISYATANSGYSKTYGNAPNSNVIATLTYNNKTWNVNIVEDLEDTAALTGGVYTSLELQNGTTTSIDILSRKVVKDTKAYEDTAKDLEDYYTQVEYVLAAFANDYYSSSGYSSSIGKYNFMMLYFRTANIDDIVKNTYRVNGAASKLLTNYNSDTLLDFFKDYTDAIYNNYFSISGQRFVVYLDANDDSKYDDVADWTDAQKDLARELVLEVLKTVSSINDSHVTALTNLVTEINSSARAKYEDNPIAPENKWSEYRKAGLSVALEEVTATNSTTTLDFALKARLLEIYNSDSYSINDTTPTEYLEDLEAIEDILQTKDGYNLLVITSADFQTSAEFSSEDDKLNIFTDLEIYYNDEYVKISDVYNDSELLNINQIRLYVLEYVTKSSSNLSPSAISTALTNFLSPVLTRYTGTETQRDVVIYLIEEMGGKITFTDVVNNDRLENILAINHNSADDYIYIYYDEDTTNTLKTYENWWTDVQNIISEILLSQGETE